MNELLNTIKSDRIQKLVSRATEYLFYLLICLIPFSIRHVFDTQWNFTTGAYSDFTSLSIYLSDLVIITLITLLFIKKQSQETNSHNFLHKWQYISVALVSWLAILLIFTSQFQLQLYFSLRLTILIIFAFLIRRINVPRENIAWLFTILGLFQSIISIAQFYLHKSIGLYFVGESHLSPTMYGVAKIVSHGTVLIRGYGTFPHSNLLSAFLVVSTLLNLYLIIKTYQQHVKFRQMVLLNMILLVNIFGVFTAFSRGGLIALFLGIAGLISILLINKRYSELLRIIVPCGTAVIIAITILNPYLLSRTSFSDNSTKERMFYNHIGLKMVKDKPISGLGTGLSVLHMKQYSKTDLKPWEIQPIHNFYLISWAEIGVGAILLIILIIFPILLLFKGLFRKASSLNYWNLATLSILGAFIVLFMVDHYFYTIWPTQILLWLFVGLALNSVSHETI